MSKAAELAALIGSQTALSNRNLIINGAMQVAQRNSSSAVTITGDGVYNTVDRFKARTFGGSGRFSMQQVTDTPDNSFTNSLKLVVTTTDTSGTNGYTIEHVVEDSVISAAGLGDSDAHPVTLSFWVKSSVTGSYSASLRANNSTGTPANVQEYTISSADTWEHKKITYPAYTAGLTLAHLLVDFGLGKQTSKTTSTLGTWQTTNFVFGNNQVDWQSNSGATFYLTGVQLELGEQATPFEHRSFADELERCKRYFQQIGSGYGKASSSSAFDCSITFNPPMRTSPTVSNNGTTVQITNITSADHNQSSASCADTDSGVTDGTYGGGRVRFSNFSGLSSGTTYAIDHNGSHGGAATFDAEL